jgi:hypothetical protein
MSSGALDLHLTDLAGEPVRKISVEFLRFSGERGPAHQRQTLRSRTHVETDRRVLNTCLYPGVRAEPADPEEGRIA